MSSEVEVRAYYRLPKAVSLSKDCLGEKLPVKLLGFNCILYMPDAQWNKNDEPYLTPPPLSEDGLARLKQHNEKHRLWGAINSWNQKDKTFSAFSLKGLLLSLELDTSKVTYSNYLYGRGHPLSDEIAMLGKDIDEWFDEFCSWVSVKTKQDLNYEHPVSSVKMPGHGLQVWTEEGQTTSLIATPNVIQISSDKDADKKALSKADFVKIVDAISNGRRPPENHLFLRDARDACRRGQMRKAAIDAGTAVEVTLRNYAISHSIPIRVTPPAMLGWYVHNTAPGLPPDTQVKLVDVRNDATHYNTAFNSALVPEAIDIATQIVESIDPLSL